MSNLFLNTLPYTEEGARLSLTEEQKHDCRVVYQRQENGDFTFAGYWNSERDYSDNYVIVPLRSVYDGVTPQPLPINTCFANVIDSAGDSCPSKSWIQLLCDHLNTSGNDVCSTCCTDGNIYEAKSVRIDVCSGDMIGGHVILGQQTMPVAEGGNVLLLPICNYHNVCTPRSQRTYYMMLGRSMHAVKLKSFLKASVIEPALREIGSL